MQTEETVIWKDVKPFSYPQKGKCGTGYGCRDKSQKRKIGRYIRHYGFDTSECWNLDVTIMCWLSDNVGGFFRECGNEDSWDEKLNPSNYMVVAELLEERRYSYQQHLKEYLESIDEDNYHQFLVFVIPRLIYFEKHFVGYPAKFSSAKEWRVILCVMLIGLMVGNVNLFVEYFFYLWY